MNYMVISQEGKNWPLI